MIPAQYQPRLPLGRFILSKKPQADAVSMDVLIVGGGPAGLACAIELARLVREDQRAGGRLGNLEIGVLEKASNLGEHCLSGAVVHAGPLLELFPDLNLKDFPFREPVSSDQFYFLTEKKCIRLPVPPMMHNTGNYTVSICELLRWLGDRATEYGVQVLTGFPAEALLVDGSEVLGVRTTPAGLTENGEKGSAYLEPTEIRSRITVLAEGTRGALTQSYLQWQGIQSPQPQIYALGVKELWQTPNPPSSVIHTLGWPLSPDTFGGSWIYPMGPGLVSFGLVVGLDYPSMELDVHQLLQDFKQHSIIRGHLEGGEILEWGAKTIPEGGYYSIPKRLHGDRLMILGDSAGLVNVASLKGIHYAVQSGIFAGRTAFSALKFGDCSRRVLKVYDEMLKASYVFKDLYQTRNMRLAFKSGLFEGGLKAGLMALSGGKLLPHQIQVNADANHPRVLKTSAVTRSTHPTIRTLSKPDAVFYSGNKTRDNIPKHLIVDRPIPPDVANFYCHMCPAGVYEWDGDQLIVNAPNCIDCKATDILGPRWTPREGGSGPRYKNM